MNCCRTIGIIVDEGTTSECFDWDTLPWVNDYLDEINDATGTITPLNGASATLAVAMDSGPTETGSVTAFSQGLFSHPNGFCLCNLRINVSEMDVTYPSNNLIVLLSAANFQPFYTVTVANTTTRSGTGTGLTISIDSVDGAGHITSYSVASGGSGYAVGDKFSVDNPNSKHSVFEVTTETGGVVTSVGGIEPSVSGSVSINVHLLTVGIHDYPFCYPIRESDDEDSVNLNCDLFHSIGGNRDNASFTIELSNA